jgi:serine/threonine protein kinase
MSETRELFSAALEIANPTDRLAMIQRACADRPQLKVKVDELLAVHAQADHFFSDCTTAISASVAELSVVGGPDDSGTPVPEISDDVAGTRIGPYKILQKIGEGGCGVVYMAEQEKPVRRRVALKIIKLGMDTKSVIARFESERQALARMDHPNIARVLDAGTTETGRPFFVMDLISGIGILEYCDKNHLDTRRRLELFVQVCNAVQHAHQKGVVHRDIKPSNILVTLNDGVPVPKVIDFGIAKAVSEPLTDKTLFTMYGCFIGTPAYMSPEQAEFSGLDVDTRSDIYSLGVVLYELLTGKTPFDQNDLMAGGFDEMRRTLREREPHRPSTKLETLTADELTVTAVRRQTETPKLQWLLKGDLDWIVMKALEKDRKRRYETANGFGMDITRYLNNEPVIARPPSRWYRFQKLVQRNHVLFAATGAVTLALLAGLGASTWSFLRERDMRHRAVAAEQAAEQARQNESRLRLEAETRAKIAQAAIELSRNNLIGAEQLAQQLQVPIAEPSLEAAGVFRTLGDWTASQDLWPEAAAHFRKLAVADEVDKSEVTDHTSYDLLRLGPTLIAAGNLASYHDLVQANLARFSHTTNLLAAEQVIKVNLICPQKDSDVAALEPLAKVLEQYLADAQPSDNPRMYAWREFSLALFAYRSGRFADAIAWQQKCLASPDNLPERITMGHFILAMAYQHLNRIDFARLELHQGQDLIRRNCPEASEKISIAGMSEAASVYWYDWVIAQILEREASDLINGPQSR